MGNRMKAFVVINPGNPTGNVLSEENIVDIIKFCYEHNMIILSDEVYQNNIYSKKKKFHSFRKIANKQINPYKNVSIFSFNSTSKGFYGE
jgi:alanine transaminase